MNPNDPMAKKSGRPSGAQKVTAKKERLSMGARCLRLHAKGWSYRRLADHLDISAATVAAYVEEALKAIPEPAVANYRKVMGGHLDDVIREHRKTMTDPESAKVLISAINSAMKLYGLSAPIQIEDVTPPDAARAGIAAKLAALLVGGAEEPVPPEPNPDGAG